jgi:MOSC domain-containing protein YiiM
MMPATIVAVARRRRHNLTKLVEPEILLFAGLGVGGDAHAGATVKHRSRAAIDPTQPNLRQVHLIQVELIDELAANGFAVAPGTMGENITTCGLDLLGLPRGTRLALGDTAVVAITGLRNPCIQLERYQAGLMQAVLGRDAAGRLVRKAGVMAIVLVGGTVRTGDAIRVTLPAAPHLPLEPV